MKHDVSEASSASVPDIRSRAIFKKVCYNFCHQISRAKWNTKLLLFLSCSYNYHV